MPRFHGDPIVRAPFWKETMGMNQDVLTKGYEPQDVESRWYASWEKEGLFDAHLDPSPKRYSIVIPPPNVTGVLHMGHALNNTLQDLVTRFKRMQGFEALWLPGMDHAGIGTQVKVEKMLAKEGKTRFDLGREGFLKRAWEWKERYGGEIIVLRYGRAPVFLNHGGHVWNTAFNVAGAFGAGTEDVLLFDTSPTARTGDLIIDIRDAFWCVLDRKRFSQNISVPVAKHH